MAGTAASSGGDECCCTSSGKRLEGLLKKFKAFGFGDEVYEIRQQHEGHMLDGESGKINAEATKELVGLV